MELERLAVNVRSRTPWEGLDLGFVIARHWFLPLWGLWWLTALPVAGLALLVFHGSPGWAAVAVWWFKPLYEPALLYWLSRRLFGESQSVRELAGEWRKVLLPRLLHNLTLWRLGGRRSLFLPVAQLEGLRGAERRKRAGVLGGGGSAAFWLTVVCSNFEGILALGAVLLLTYLLPESLRSALWTPYSGVQPALIWLGNGFWLLAMSLIAPFYVAGGFSLYLNRRSQLEAWDLELPFRRMAPRFRGGSAVALVCCAVLALTLMPVRGAHAAQQASGGEAFGAISEPTYGLQVRRAVTKVLAAPVFGREKVEHYWKRVGPGRKTDAGKALSVFEWVAYVADLLKYLLMATAALALGWLLVYTLRHGGRFPRRRRAGVPAAATTLFGMPITPDSLPADVAGAVRGLLERELSRDALSLLYRATLAHLVNDCRMHIPESATERECRRLVGEQRPASEAALFGRLTDMWTRCAYAHAPPDAADIAALADDWGKRYRSEGDA
jgi:hypothetical protein